MKLATTVADVRQYLDNEAVSRNLTIGFVPTMGALHRGHLALVERARRDCDVVVVSIFVNPTQFNNAADLATYPRTLEADCRLLEQAGADLAFAPGVADIYPEPDTRIFPLGEVADTMEGPQRPGHFNGVCQVVSRLFDIVRPTRAYFGEKDFQQVAVIRRLVQILRSPVEIVAVPIVRADDGLALSSRNVRLSADQRALAPEIYRVLQHSLALKQQGATPADVKRYVVETLGANPAFDVEYYEIVHPLTMQSVDTWPADLPAQGCITVWMGDVRLIDNIKYL